jgi:hypothetical protein
MHQAIGKNTLRILSPRMDPPCGSTSSKQLVDTAIANAVYVTRCTFNNAIKPGGFAFGQDMILNIPLITDLE